MGMVNVVKIMVVRSKHGPDYVYFHTTLTPSVWPYKSDTVLSATVAAGSAEEWLTANGFNQFELVNVS